MKFIIKKKSIWQLFGSSCLIYILCFGLWDYLSYVPKILFNSLLITIITYEVLLILKRKYFTGNKNFDLLFFASILYYCFSVIFLTSSELKITGFYMYVYYQFILIATFAFLKKIYIEFCFTLFKVFGCISSLLAVYEMINSKLILGGIGYGKSYMGSYIVRAVVFSDSFLTLGMFFSIIILISMYHVLRKKNLKVNLLISIINVIGLLMTSSRGPLVATIVGYIVMYFLINPIDKTKTIKRIINIILIFICISLLSYLVLDGTQGNDFYFEYVKDRLNSILDWTGESGNIGRLTRWQQFLILFKQNFLFGSGVGTSGTRAAELVGALNPESGLFKRFLELGVIGAIPFYYMILNIVLQGIKIYKKNIDKKNYICLPLSIAIIIAILVEDCVMQITETVMVTALFWLFFAHILICITVYKKGYQL